jgi:hypothetical protein
MARPSKPNREQEYITVQEAMGILDRGHTFVWGHAARGHFGAQKRSDGRYVLARAQVEREAERLRASEAENDLVQCQPA